MFKQTFQSKYPDSQYPKILDDIIKSNNNRTSHIDWEKQELVCDRGYDTVDISKSNNQFPTNEVNNSSERTNDIKPSLFFSN